MGDIAIRVEGLGKQYRIGALAHGGHTRYRYKALRDVLSESVLRPFRAIRSLVDANGRPRPKAHETIWALKGFSLEIKPGEVVGIIGRNGAGKSTLLKILSRITEPTEGYAEIHGRVGSLLEVGTGFHPELSGRDNIYLNGAILGMRKAEIERKFDEIVDFAEVHAFLDTPVKHYSSGMYMRLAFSVAAHLESEVLLVDEILAVGDAAFQEKCLGKMGEVAHKGRTVLFVSHNMAAIRQLCPKTTLIQSGKLLAYGDTPAVIELYESAILRRESQPSASASLYQTHFDSERQFQILGIDMLSESHQPKPRLCTWDYVRFRIHYHARHRVANGSVVFFVDSLEHFRLLLCSTQPDSNVPMALEPGHNYVDCEFPSWPLAAGRYLVGAALAVPMVEWLTPTDHLATIEVHGRDVFQSGLVIPHARRALLAVPHVWKINGSSS